MAANTSPVPATDLRSDISIRRETEERHGEDGAHGRREGDVAASDGESAASSSSTATVKAPQALGKIDISETKVLRKRRKSRTSKDRELKNIRQHQPAFQ